MIVFIKKWPGKCRSFSSVWRWPCRLKRLLCWLILICLSLSLQAQHLWDGEGGDGEWSNPLNWASDETPGINDAVLLDNEFIKTGYTVRLPGGSATTVVRMVRIAPSGGNPIELTLPSDNTSLPGFVAAGDSYGLIIEEGGIFRNASGAVSGLPVSIADSIRINDGGRYIHQTAAGHAANIQRLSSAPGTEKGVTEIDSPDLSTTLSLSGRVYGKLALKADAAGGTLNYTAAGTNRLTIRSDLEIGQGVNLSLNFGDTIFIARDLIQRGGMVNLGNTARNAVVSIGGDLLQMPGSVMTETGAGEPAILLAGKQEQKINMQGAILNSISFVMNGWGAVLQHPLTLPYRLELIRGRIATNHSALLTLLPSCTLKADSLSDNSFINGPLQKQGLTAEGFLFPVGINQTMRWLSLKNASGSFTVAYRRSDPSALSVQMGEGIDHISSLEYWSIAADDDGSAEAIVELSFDDPNSGGVTSLQDLRTARLLNESWINAGNTAVTGSPGANGSVISEAIIGFTPGENHFTLGSSIAGQNALPLPDNRYRMRRELADNIKERSPSVSLTSTIVRQCLEMKIIADEKIHIRTVIYNMQGRAFKKDDIVAGKGPTVVSLDIDNIPAGWYCILATSGSSRLGLMRFLKR